MGEILVFSSKKISDSRGFFSRAFCQNTYKQNNAMNKIDQINFSLKKRETLGIVGESGSGKTSLVLAILKLSLIHI